MSLPKIGIACFDAFFRFSVKHASATKNRTDNVIVWIGEPGTQNCGYGEACPRHYVTGESAETVRRFVSAHAAEILSASNSLPGLRDWICANSDLIDSNPAAFAAVEGAILDRIGRKLGMTLEEIVAGRTPNGATSYSAVLGDARRTKFLAQAFAYRLFGLRDIKVKLCDDPEHDRWKFRLLETVFSKGTPIRADANNLWNKPSEAISHLSFVASDLWAVEEPLKPKDFDGLRLISEALDLKIILDESLRTSKDLLPLRVDPDRWIANIRVSKVGGILRSIDLAKRAAETGLEVIIGAHVGETSLLTRAALAVASSLPVSPIAREGAFGTRLLVEDICARSIMFGRHGHLNASQRSGLDGPGSGLIVRHERLRTLNA